MAIIDLKSATCTGEIKTVADGDGAKDDSPNNNFNSILIYTLKQQMLSKPVT